MSTQPFADLDRIILSSFPYPLALTYQKMRLAQNSEIRVQTAIVLFEQLIKSLSLVVISDYLRDENREIRDDQFTKLLLDELPIPQTVATSVEILFAGTRAFASKPENIFIPELLSSFWEVNNTQAQPRTELRGRIDDLVQERNRLRFAAPTEPNWDSDSERILPKIEHLLTDLVFIGRYNIVLILRKHGEAQEYQRWNGVNISIGEFATSAINLTESRFYITPDFKRFMKLHPMIIMDEAFLGGGNLENLDYYHAFVNRESVLYIRVPKQEELTTTSTLTDVRSVYFFWLLDEKRPKQLQALDHLTWGQLAITVAEINDLRANTSYREFHDPRKLALFVPRNSILREFEQFITSAKLVLVILGKSGVGKSSSISALGHRYRNNPRTHVLIYDCAKFSVDANPIDEVVNDLNMHLNLTGSPNQISRDSLISFLSELREAEDENFMLVFDAINESATPVHSLKSIENFATHLHSQKLTWLRIIITSRPQSWIDIVRQLKGLTEGLYYLSATNDTIGINLLDFTPDELSDAFLRYQTFHSLKTDYDKLTVVQRKVLQDPLQLALLSRAYTGQTLPHDFRPRQLYRQYIDSLLFEQEQGRGRLRASDITFLTNFLLPIFIKDCTEDGIRNTVSTQTLYETRDVRGNSLFELIRSSDLLPNGDQVNQSFVNLTNADILILRGSNFDPELGFRYERFWEYFGGLRLLELITTLDEHTYASTYLNLAIAARKKSYLLGVIRVALLEHVTSLLSKKPDVAHILLSKLASDETTANLIEEVLTILGEEHVLSVETLKILLNVPSTETDAKVAVTRKRVAILVAARFMHLDILEMAATDKDPVVRLTTLLGILQLWYKDRKTGNEFLNRLAEKAVSRFGLPVNKYFEPLLGMSLFLYFREYRDPQVGQEFLKIWRPLIGKILHYSPGQKSSFGHVAERLKGIFRRRLIDAATTFVVRLAGEGRGSSNPLSIPELRAFYKQDDGLNERQRIGSSIVRFFAVDSTDIQDLGPILIDTANSKHMLINFFAMIALSAHLRKSPDNCVAIAEQLFEIAGKTDDVGPLYGYGPFWTFAMATRPEYEPRYQEFLERYKHLLISMWDRTGGWYSTATGRIRMINVAAMVHCEAAKRNSPITPSVIAYLDKLIEAHDYETLKHLIQYDLTYAGIGEGRYEVAFSGIEQIMKIENVKSVEQGAIGEIRDLSIRLLRQLQAFYPEHTTDFLARADFSVEFVREISTQAPVGKVSDLWATQALQFWEDAIVRTKSPELWRKVTWIFSQMPESPNLESWLSILLRSAVNLIYGEAVFPEIEKAQRDFQ